ncbi:trimeric intracellular cation channel family protein [Poseidonocella sedimentorum]|uniref:Uncharacterized membrane protein YeiH n=1 Tax=Poseidonocella sedimentorum TaxID=871652 RepID=A0A1I6DM09_9RHOB|nr:trimeric intracellular cation channel family protein [Poseidonocella sedimentorum]SFR06422.1 Uncharacterized membrane protein YeiH [Poseidonocella sedimentorum]
MTFVDILDFAGVALFAATGALVASRKELDIVAFLFFAVVTATGGGTVRDLILDTPVFWLADHSYVLISVAVAVGVYFFAHLIEYRYGTLLWLDAVALSAFSVLGAEKGLMLTGSPIVAVLSGTMTAALGGIIRDVIAGEPTVVSRKEIYITAAALGAGAFTLLVGLGLGTTLAALIGVCTAFVIRGGGLAFGWSLPPYRTRPGRPV